MTTVARRSFVHERLIIAGGTDWRPAHGGQVPGHFGAPEADRGALVRLALVDLSLYPRTGFKGAGAPEWLARQGVQLLEPNCARRQADGTLALRLAPREALLLTDRSGEHDFSSLEAAWHADRSSGDAGPIGFPVPRSDSHLWFLLTGAYVPEMLAKLCGVDLRPHKFAPLAVAQTQAARSSVIIVRDDTALPAWHLLADSASAVYLWDCLLDAMAEWQGRPVGIDALTAWQA